MEQESRLKEKTYLFYFLALSKFNMCPSHSFFSEDFMLYKKRCKLVSKKIDKWHNKVALVKQGSFLKDEDFVMANQSPSYFSDSSEGAGNEVQRVNTHEYSLKKKLSLPKGRHLNA